jgi:Smg protein
VNESIIDVLIYIYEHYMDADESTQADQILLEEELIKAGFSNGDIEKAFDWLDELAWRQGSIDSDLVRQPSSFRIYTDLERQRLDTDIQGMLHYLEQAGILDMVSRELVIERAMAIESHELTADDIKWVVLLVLLNQPGRESAFALMEELIYNGEAHFVH